MAALLEGVTVSLFFCSGIREYLVVLFVDGQVVAGPFAIAAEAVKAREGWRFLSLSLSK
jgi:hypothetical protein